MIDGILFWLSLPVALALLALFFLALGALLTFPSWLTKKRCKHLEYYETRSCDAICVKCDKNLGFIAPVRADKSKREV